MRALVVVVLSLWSCAAVVPDWHARPKGMHQEHEPEFRVWTVPWPDGEAGDVVVFARANHAPHWRGAALEIRINSRKLGLLPAPDLSWSTTVGLPAGRHTFRVRLLLYGEPVAEKTVCVRLHRPDEVSR